MMMKEHLNRAAAGAGKKVDEEFLFKAMAQGFNSAVSRCTYVQEIHGKLYVDYASKYAASGTKRVELGDLWIFTFDKATGELRMCIMQTKYRQKRYYRFLDLDVNVFQWELLRDKPDISGCGWYVPSDLLNFQKSYKSITAYGVFYHDNTSKTRDIDFLYTLPAFLEPKSPLTPPLIQKDQRFEFVCPAGSGSPNRLCERGFLPRETVSTCAVDIFEQQVLSCRVGVPLKAGGSSVSLWVLSLLSSMRRGAEDAAVIDTILERYPAAGDVYASDRRPSDGIPRALIVVTDSGRYESLRREEGDFDGLRRRDR